MSTIHIEPFALVFSALAAGSQQISIADRHTFEDCLPAAFTVRPKSADPLEEQILTVDVSTAERATPRVSET
jgi:hypothetical protein